MLIFLKMMVKSSLFTGLLAGIVLLCSGNAGFAATKEESHVEKEHGEAFQPGVFIMEHVVDAYEWHILSYKDHHISLPLPVVLYSRYSGFHVFLSNRFHHGHDSYRGFEISHEEKNKGQIVERLADGSIIKPVDLSVTKNVFAIFISSILLVWIFSSVAKRYKKSPLKAPTGFQNLIEPLILFIRDDIAKPSIGEHEYERFMPYLLSLFFFILLNNLLGLVPFIPFGANVTGNIGVTGILALFTLLMIMYHGNRHFWQEIFNAPGVPFWLKLPVPLMPVIELFGLLTKPMVLMVRLFANITAGHIIAMGFFSLIFIFGNMSPLIGLGVSPLTVVFTMFMTILEILVAFIQAYVFTMLSALYFGMAVAKHH